MDEYLLSCISASGDDGYTANLEDYMDMLASVHAS